MISPEEIKRQASKWWVSILQSEITGNVFFPKVIDRIGKVQPGSITHQFGSLQQAIEQLYRHSKNQTGTGYTVRTEERNFRRAGNHELPNSIVFETIEDYIYFTGKKKEWTIFLNNYKKIITDIPVLKEWVIPNCLWLTDGGTDWINILKVCQYFINTPRPNLYLRQLPIEIHTKFIEDNVTLIQSLLDHLIPGHIRNAGEKRFAARYFLKYDEPLIRIRFLGDKSAYKKLRDISIPLTDFALAEIEQQNILITENKMNFLTLPPIDSTIAVWSGGGFNVSYLKDVKWLYNKDIFYWGDIDEHGFQILHQLRSYFSFVKSVLMDKATFDLFSQYAVNGSKNKSTALHLLTEDENTVFQLLKLTNSLNRLEQEKIPQFYSDRILKHLISTQTD